jgi:hypothetical protein
MLAPRPPSSAVILMTPMRNSDIVWASCLAVLSSLLSHRSPDAAVSPYQQAGVVVVLADVHPLQG